ncbi:hypothetical protein CA13_63430 [Planctomycetes bacterium CA13]|uniref:Intein C-terminal splicing domain-containing protein n=1 Tax=Novipirellula herctigrandis TaxID=2527986 RepID=A0A5C5ZC19_9BACT|nr:hypothetical protein CA13_63430 [Planctomycetes bacterium CA13]
MPQGEQLQSALWANDSFLDDITDHYGSVALLEAPAKTATTFKIPIEDVPLGARVPTKNPRPWEYDDSLPDPDEETWSKVIFTVERKDGQMVDAEILRPTSWLTANGIEAGALLPINLPELEVHGEAFVESIEPCPLIAAGEGSVVTARFVTRQVDRVASIEILGPNGQIETLTGTTVHPIWSVDRQDWVELAELHEGEMLQAATGIAAVLSVTVHDRTTPVYNNEVHGEHVYQVGELGLLVHNACPDALDIHRAAKHGGDLHDLAMRLRATMVARTNTTVRTNQVLVDGNNVLSRLRPDIQWIEDGLVHVAEVNISGGSGYHGARRALFEDILGPLFGGYKAVV